MQVTREEKERVERALKEGMLRALFAAGRLSPEALAQALAALHRA